MSAHLPALPVIVPLLAGALLLLVERRGIAVQRTVAWLGMAALLALSIALLQLAGDDVITIYRIGPHTLGSPWSWIDCRRGWCSQRPCLRSPVCCMPMPAGTVARRIFTPCSNSS